MDTSDEFPGDSTRKGNWWSDSEHEVFLHAYQMHGKNWKKIAELVETRTIAQVRSHAQKYFMKLQRRSAREQAKREKSKVPVKSEKDIPNLMSLPQECSQEKLLYENYLMRNYIQTIANVNIAFFREIKRVFAGDTFGGGGEQVPLQPTAWNLSSGAYPFGPTYPNSFS